MYHYEVCCFGSSCTCNLYGRFGHKNQSCFPRKGLKLCLSFFCFVLFSNKYQNSSHWKSLLIRLGQQIHCFVMFSFGFVLFLLSETLTSRIPTDVALEVFCPILKFSCMFLQRRLFYLMSYAMIWVRVFNHFVKVTKILTWGWYQ